MRTMIEEYGMFMVASLSFFALMVVLEFFMKSSNTVARSFIADITGSNQSIITDWSTW